MSQRWADFIETGSYAAPGGDPVEFDFVSVRDERPRRQDIQELDGRPGARVVDRCAGPRRFDVLAVFVFDPEELSYDPKTGEQGPGRPAHDDYPERMKALIAAIDAGGPGDFVHPIFGRMKAAVERSTVSHDINDGADCATMQLGIIEHTADPPRVAQPVSVPALASEVRANADAVASSNIDMQRLFEAIEEAANVLATIPDAAQAAANATVAFVNDVELDTTVYSADELTALADVQLAAIDAVIEANGDYQWQEQYDLDVALRAMADATRRFVTAIVESKPPLVWRTVDADIPLLAWVFAIYGDPGRVDEVLALNSIPDPVMLPAGMRLRAYAV